MLSPSSLNLVKATAPVVAEHAEAITTEFYKQMFAGHPAVRAYFNQAHQHSGRQQQALAAAICAYAANIDRLDQLGDAVALIAHKHCSLQIQPEHYPIVGHYLMQAIHTVLGSAVTPEIDAAWREAYAQLAEICIQAEAEIYQQQREQPGGWNGYRPFRVVRKQPESQTICSFYLEPADGGPLPPFLPGQFITLSGQNTSPPTAPRNYSLSDAPGSGQFRISVKREPGLSPTAPAGIMSHYLHDHVHVGDLLEIGPPCGTFVLHPPHANEQTLTFLAAGIGITPLLAMLKSLQGKPANWGRVQLIHAVRDAASQPFAAELADLTRHLSELQVHIRYEVLPTETPDELSSSEGRIDRAFLTNLLDEGTPAGGAFYLCGPAPFMRAVHADLVACGVHSRDIHWEFFGPQQAMPTPPAPEYATSGPA